MDLGVRLELMKDMGLHDKWSGSSEDGRAIGLEYSVLEKFSHVTAVAAPLAPGVSLTMVKSGSSRELTVGRFLDQLQIKSLVIKEQK